MKTTQLTDNTLRQHTMFSGIRIKIGVAAGFAAAALAFASAAHALPVEPATATPPHSLTVDASMNNNNYQNPALCEAACFAATYGFSTVPYFTLDQPRSLSLVYNSDRTFPRPFIFTDVTPDQSGIGVSQYRLSAVVNGSQVTFLNGDTYLNFYAPTETVRLAGQFDAQSMATGVYPMVLTVSATYDDGGVVTRTVPTELMIVNEAGSRVAPGWSIAGAQRLYTNLAAGGYMITGGDGSATRFSSLGSVAPDFSVLAWDAGYLTRTYPDATKVRFDGNGNAWIVVDPWGRGTWFSYDASGHVTQVYETRRAALNAVPYLQLDYNGNGTLAHIVEQGGSGPTRTTTLGYNGSVQLVSIADPDGVATTFSYDGSGRLASVTDRKGAATSFTYDAYSWKLAQITSPQVPVDAGSGNTTPGTPVTQFTAWQTFGVPTISTSSYPAFPLRSADITGTVRDPLGRETSFSPNRFGQSTRTVDPAGRVTSTAYSGFLPTIITHVDGTQDHYSYDASGRLSTSQPAGSEVLYYSYGGPFGQLSYIGGNNTYESRTYDGAGRLSVTSSGSQSVQFQYDAATQRPSSSTDQSGHATSFSYDAVFGNTAQVIAPGNRTTSTGYDAYGRPVTVSAPSLAPVTTAYDVLNRVTSQSEGSNPAVVLTWDNLFRTSLTDQNGNVFVSSYNALGWPVQECEQGVGCRTTRSNAAGEVTSTTNRRGQLVSLTRDALGRVTTKSGSGIPTDSFSYSSDGQRIVASNAVETDSIRIVRGSQYVPPRDTVVTWLGGRRYQVVHVGKMAASGYLTTEVSSSNGVVFNTRSFAFDDIGRLSAIDAGFGTTTVNYNADGLVGSIAWPSGVTSDRNYVSLHAAKGVGYNVQQADDAFHRDYHMDGTGRVDAMFAPASGRRAFAFDELGRLTGQTSESGCYLAADDDTSGRSFSCGNTTSSESLSYDAAGNRTDLGGVPVAFNRYQYFNGNEFYYDADGNVTKKYKPGLYNREFFWGADNRLDLAQLNSWSKVQYEYNAFGQPVKVSAGDPNGMTVHHYLLWDGDQLLAVIDANGQRIADYIYLPGIDQPFAQTLGASYPSAIRYHQQDELGNVTGTIEGSYPSQTVTYSMWGEPTAEGNWDNVLLWKGLMWEGDPARLYYMRNRWYDPDAGRFMSEDPIGHDGGMNLYAFAGNDPANGSDPSGLDCPNVKERCTALTSTISAPLSPGCEPGMETNVHYCDMMRDRWRFFEELQTNRQSWSEGIPEQRFSGGSSAPCGVAIAHAVFATLEDFGTLAGIGLATKGIRGARVLPAVLDALLVETAGYHRIKGNTARGIALAASRQAGHLGFGAFMSAAAAEEHSAREIFLSYIPIVNMGVAWYGTREKCR